MRKNDVWSGYLQADDQISPVVRNARLETNSPKTIYLFNYVRGQFPECSREIFKPNLLDLLPDNVSLNELKSALKAAHKEFVSNRST